MRIGWRSELVLATVLGVAGVNAALAQGVQGAGGRGPGGASPAAPPMKLTSPAFTDASKIPDKYGCSAQPANVSPALQWSEVPAGTVSFTLILHDLEPRPARGVEDFLHWMVWNIPATTTQLVEGVAATPEQADGTRQMVSQGRNGGPAIGFRSPCPPPGPSHHYVFELFALDTKLDVPPAGTRADVMKAMDGHVIGHAVLIGLFNR
jgi:Raf kinase inhibitor-like YbhB/YbcL family protein